MHQKHITVLGECVADAFTTPEPGTAPHALPTPEPNAGTHALRTPDPAAGTHALTTPDPAAAPHGLTLRVLPGGGPANTAVALGRLGTPTRFLGRLSHDVFGTLFRARLTASGVDLTGCATAPESSTLAVADLDPAGQATYSFFADGTADWQWTDAELAAAPLDDTVCLHTGSLALVRDPGGPRIEEFLGRVRSHTTVSIDPNVRPLLVAPAVYRERLARWCALADILRLSEDDLAFLAPGATPEDACDTWHAAGARLVVITLGERGALASLDGERATVPAPPTTVVDTVGAGDSFTAGLLHRLDAHGRLGGRLDGLTLHEVVDACSYAVRVAARTCSVPGADPPWADREAI
ncbi:carbohydrate kinase [Streptomyces sp. NPDC087850]|uniref:carbohydrate kinase family protein n=1 Tax=Streptomyces sp. NPDC087850 TaxID=3365809 RepID=UPI0037F7E4B4